MSHTDTEPTSENLVHKSEADEASKFGITTSQITYYHYGDYRYGVPPLKWSAWKVQMNRNSGGPKNGKQPSEARGNRLETAPG